MARTSVDDAHALINGGNFLIASTFYTSICINRNQ